MPAGRFLMGSPPGEPDRDDDEGPQHTVTIARPFAAGKYEVRLWRSGTGSQLALYPNLNANDPVWRALFRDARFRRALSLGIDRHEINQVIFYGLAHEGQNTVLPRSPLYRDDYRRSWAEFDLDRANRLLDEIGLQRDGEDGPRRLPDGRLMEIIVESAGEGTEESDILRLIADSWAKLGISLFTKVEQREVFRNRIFAGETLTFHGPVQVPGIARAN